jgi:calcineurin-like phosphoesterase family protein
MDATLIENMWNVVGPEDHLWILGDFAFGAKAKDPAYLEAIFLQLPGAEKHLIVGNHDLAPTLELPWTSVSQMVELKDGASGPANTLCHYPMITWNHARKGALQLFGHVHNNWKGSNNSVNVGVDVWDFMPVSINDIARRAKTLPKNKHWGDVEPRSS